MREKVGKVKMARNEEEEKLLIAEKNKTKKI